MREFPKIKVGLFTDVVSALKGRSDSGKGRKMTGRKVSEVKLTTLDKNSYRQDNYRIIVLVSG